jgi:hypothetical protein
MCTAGQAAAKGKCALRRCPATSMPPPPPRPVRPPAQLVSAARWRLRRNAAAARWRAAARDLPPRHLHARALLHLFDPPARGLRPRPCSPSWAAAHSSGWAAARQRQPRAAGRALPGCIARPGRSSTVNSSTVNSSTVARRSGGAQARVCMSACVPLFLSLSHTHTHTWAARWRARWARTRARR